MSLKQKTITDIFESINNLKQASIYSNYTNISSFFMVKHSNQKQNKIALKDNLLLISKKINEEFQYTHKLVLDESIKFQRFYGEHNSIKKLKGFRIINSNKQYVDIQIEFEDLTRIWLRQLGKQINQIGFHQVYQIIRKIGNGSTANVYEIRRIEDQQILAAKVILKSFVNQKQERMKSLNQQISLLRVLQHQNIIKLNCVFESDKAIYLIFERLLGGNLVERINKQRGFTLSQAKQIMKGIIQGLAYLHKFNIAHRDIKLQNIIFKQENSLNPVIADLGLAIFTQQEPYLYYRCGTPGYIAPEIIKMKKNKKVNAVCDIYSAGIIFHVLLTNRYLYEGKSKEQIYQQNCEAKIRLSGEKYCNIDPQALNLLQKMLTVKVSGRISADQILDQQFLEYTESQNGLISPVVTELGEDYTI